MKKGLTEVVFILDRSGSMSGLVSDTIGGYNSMLKKQKKNSGEAYISTVLFDTVCEVLHDRVPIDKINEITENEYNVRGCTALLDAVGGAIRHIGNVHKYSREEDVPENTIFIITTDGMENASRAYDFDKVKYMIERQKEKYGWQFLFLGANIDAANVGSKMGISKDFATDFLADSKGLETNFDAVDSAITQMRRCGQVNASWQTPIAADYKKRSFFKKKH